MTKVLVNMGLLAFRVKMRDALLEVVVRTHIKGAPQPYVTIPPFTQEHLLVAPSIGFIALDEYTGQGDDYIGLVASHDVGIHSMHIRIVDDQGNWIESGEMSPFLEDPNAWEYFPQVCVPPGTTVIVQVTAVDRMGGIGIRWERKTLGDDEL